MILDTPDDGYIEFGHHAKTREEFIQMAQNGEYDKLLKYLPAKKDWFIDIPTGICKSAKIDGASDLGILLKIMLPMATAPVSVVFLTQFTWSWNDLMFGLTFTKSFDVRPVMFALAQMGQQHLPALMLGCAAASIPTLVLFFILQRNFETGFVYTTK